MSIFLNRDSRIIVQGITGAEGMRHTRRMLAAGSTVVGGVNPRKAGTVVSFDEAELPVYVSVVFVPPRFVKDAVEEAVDAGVGLVVVITEGVPVHDTVSFRARAESAGVRLIGPNCPGLISPGQSNAGIIPADITKPGRIGLVSKSGTLTYQLLHELRDIGFSTAVGIGGDPVIGTTDTDLIVMIGEIGGDAEERAADFIKADVTKPVVGYVAGFTAPEGRTMGHAGAIVSGSTGTAAAKAAALEAAGVRVGKTPSEAARLMHELVTG